MYISDLLKINLHLFQIKIYNFRKKNGDLISVQGIDSLS